jgi:ATP-dependent Clp protease adaptor protein ClpS
LTNIWFRLPTHTGYGFISVIRMCDEPLNRVELVMRRKDRCQRISPMYGDVNSSEIPLDGADSAGTDTNPVTTPAEIRETSPGKQDRWAVVLFDDTHHSMDYVIWALLKTLPELSVADASLIMLEAHNTGKGVVTLCGRQQAVGYRDALRVLQLGCDVEPGW